MTRNEAGMTEKNPGMTEKKARKDSPPRNGGKKCRRRFLRSLESRNPAYKAHTSRSF
ncbi:MAG: hypothetical protein OXU61_01695 [Gammaproteobacteria bacterium]|nr:hypothetical protein [Gammaproteobacteria bacterium]